MNDRELIQNAIRTLGTIANYSDHTGAERAFRQVKEMARATHALLTYSLAFGTQAAGQTELAEAIGRTILKTGREEMDDRELARRVAEHCMFMASEDDPSVLRGRLLSILDDLAPYLASRPEANAATEIEQRIAGLRAEVLEEAAKVCETNALVSGSPGPLFNAGWGAANKADAAAIRARH